MLCREGCSVLVIWYTAFTTRAAIPNGDAVGQVRLSDATVQVTLGSYARFPQPPQMILWAFFTTSVMLNVQVSSILMWMPRYLKFPTMSASEQWLMRSFLLHVLQVWLLSPLNDLKLSTSLLGEFQRDEFFTLLWDSSWNTIDSMFCWLSWHASNR